MPRSFAPERASVMTAGERASRAPGPAVSIPPSVDSTRDVAQEDFLFHLYRGSELLQENRVHEAKEELEFALTMQPLDAKGQDLLAAVYFRLGLYPRAIQIYEALAAQFPRDVAVKINLGLGLLKTGQAERASFVLQEAVVLNPEHKRAWGYLGLAHQRLGEVEHAQAAFERGGHPEMARRATEARSRSLLPAAAAPESLVPPESTFTFDAGPGADPVAAAEGRVAPEARAVFTELDVNDLRFAVDPEAPKTGEGPWAMLEIGEAVEAPRVTVKTMPYLSGRSGGPQPAPAPAPSGPREATAPAPAERAAAARLNPVAPAPSVAVPVSAPAAPSVHVPKSGYVAPLDSNATSTADDAFAHTRLVPPPPSLGTPGLPLAHVPNHPVVARPLDVLGPGDDGDLALHPTGVLVTRIAAHDGRAFVGRMDAVRVVAGSLATQALRRRNRDGDTGELLGGTADPLVRMEGDAELVLGPRIDGAGLSLLGLSGELAFVREECLLGFESSLSYESGRIALDPTEGAPDARPEPEGAAVVQLRGTGTVVLELNGPLTTLPSVRERPLLVRREWIVGWLGRLMPRAVGAAGAPNGQRGLVSFSGEGAVLMRMGS